MLNVNFYRNCMSVTLSDLTGDLVSCSDDPYNMLKIFHNTYLYRVIRTTWMLENTKVVLVVREKKVKSPRMLPKDNLRPGRNF